MTSRPDRRTVVAGLGALVGGLRPAASEAQSMSSSAELVLYNGRITTLDRQRPEAEAVAMVAGALAEGDGTEAEYSDAADDTPASKAWSDLERLLHKPFGRMTPDELRAVVALAQRRIALNPVVDIGDGQKYVTPHWAYCRWLTTSFSLSKVGQALDLYRPVCMHSRERSALWRH